MRAILLIAALLASACASSSAAPRTAGDVFRNCRDCPQMVAIPGGQFMMSGYDFEDGSRRPVQRVSVQDFAIGRYEVTFEEWEACVRGGGCASNPNPNDQGWGRGRRPVINVSWNDAREYVQWLSAHTGQSYRLPSEAEWEYADEHPNRGVVAFVSTVGGETTALVGPHQPNYFEIHDKGGNVSEWVEDAWRVSITDAPADGSDSLTAIDQRVRLGSNWQDGWGRRVSTPAEERVETLGFRVALSLTGVRNPNPLPPPLSGPPEPPMERGFYVLDDACGDYQSPMTLRRSTTLHASRDPAATVVATARGGDKVTIADCRVLLRPRRGEVLRTDHGFEAGRPVYYLHDNTPEMFGPYFEHDMLVEYFWHQGEVIALGYEDLFQDDEETPQSLFNWEQSDQPQTIDGGGCWYLLEAGGVRGWSQSADIDCFWTGRQPEDGGARGLDGRHPRLAYALPAGDDIVDAAFSPDGSRIVTTSNDGTRTWDAESGALVAAAPSAGMSSVTIEGNVATVRAADGRVVASVRDDESYVSEAILVADGTRLATLSGNQTASLWDVATGRRLFVFGGDFQMLHGFTYFPGFARIVTWGSVGADGEADEPARIWNAANGQLLYHTPQMAVAAPAFSPNGRQFAIVAWDNVTIFNTRTGRAVRTLHFSVHQESVHSVAFSPDGTRVLTSDPGNTASVWDIATGELVLRLDPFDTQIPGVEPAGDSMVRHASFSPDGTRILTVGYSMVQVWDLTRSAFVYP